MDPPTSFACAIGTIPEATAAAAPPLEPPGVSFGFHGLRVGPNRFGSVVVPMANSGKFVFPKVIRPEDENFW